MHAACFLLWPVFVDICWFVEVESTKRQTTSEDRSFAMKQGSSCLEKGKEREFSELPRPQQINCLPKLLGKSCEDLNIGDIVRTGKQNMAKS